MNRISLFTFFLCFILPGNLKSFVTSDPNTLLPKSGECCVGSEGGMTTSGRDFSGSLPYCEFNYGVVSNLQIHFLIPLNVDKPRNESALYGIGEVEFGLKWRFIDETGSLPQVGTFVLIQVPAKIFLPILLQKNWDKWVISGGPGVWIRPGKDAETWLQISGMVQRKITDSVWVGTELVYQMGADEETFHEIGGNIGGGIELGEHYQLVGSVGSTSSIGEVNYAINLCCSW